FDVLVWYWHPADHIEERARADMVAYPLWVEQRFIRATPGNIVDYRFIRRDIQRLTRILDVREIAYDRWSATELVQDLQDQDGVTMVEFGQGYASMNAPACELERRVLGGLVALPDNPVLTWQASNVVVRMDPAGNIKPDKEKSRKRIDGIVALVMALGRATVGANERSVYQERGIRTL
ncbi:MAG: terminase large subunit, partial [Gemmatimonadaceae bacterium]|nr:terminase large subunit [Gemmatimonadaceae bacterium]